MIPTEYWALTIYQPWATLIIEGWKPFEFRSWAPPVWLVDHKLAIHAGRRPVKREEIAGLLFKLNRGGDAAKKTGLIHHDKVVPFLERLMTAPKSLPMSAILGICDVGRPLRDKDMAEAIGLPVETLLVNDSDRDQHSNLGWPLKVVARCRPLMPVAGKQGLWLWKKPQSVGIHQEAAHVER